MPSNFTLYSPHKRFPEDYLYRTDLPLDVKIDRQVKDPEIACQYILTLSNFKITLNVMRESEMPNHLKGLAGYVIHLYNGKPDKRGQLIIQRILSTGMVLGGIIEPDADSSPQTLQLVYALAEMTKSMIFINGYLLDHLDRRILAPDLQYDRRAIIDPAAPSKPWWKFW